MKRVTEINYLQLYIGLNNIDKQFENLKIDFNVYQYYTGYYNGGSNSRFYLICGDVERLSKQLIYLFFNLFKNFKFIDFYDKGFTDAFKTFVKDKEQFLQFVLNTNTDIKQFFELSTYICPTAFTSNLIKFIKEVYLQEYKDV